MSKKQHNKQYQLWVWYALQDGNKPQSGYCLALETDSPDELYLAVIKLDKDDEYLTTEKVDLKVQVI